MESRRNIYRKLAEWKAQDTGRVLELKGVRQVGKTYILKKFGRENFGNMVYIKMAEPSGEDFLRCFSMAMEWQPGEPRPEKPLQKVPLCLSNRIGFDMGIE